MDKEMGLGVLKLLQKHWNRIREEVAKQVCFLAINQGQEEGICVLFHN